MPHRQMVAQCSGPTAPGRDGIASLWPTASGCSGCPTGCCCLLRANTSRLKCRLSSAEAHLLGLLPAGHARATVNCHNTKRRMASQSVIFNAAVR